MAADLIETLFSAMDVNGDGSISKDEMNAVFKSFDADGITLLGIFQIIFQSLAFDVQIHWVLLVAFSHTQIPTLILLLFSYYTDSASNS